jgi:dipeptidyl aminopeptidase/acylaminoacyl peptidase
VCYGSTNAKTDTVLRGFHETRNYALDEQGTQLAFVAERDSVPKALVKFYKLWYYEPGMDSAVLRADRNTIALPMTFRTDSIELPPTERLSYTVSPDFVNRFSKDGDRLFWGIAPIRPPRDTTLADFETARLDVWSYTDDYLQPQQLVQLNAELKRSYMALFHKGDSVPVLLSDADCETVVTTHDGDGKYALGMSTRGYRIQQQWEQNDLHHLFLVNLTDGHIKWIRDGVRGTATLSPGGKYVLWYDWKERHWYTYSIGTGQVADITKGISAPLYDEEDDHPDDPPPHGYMAWLKDDAKVYIYDKYDIWQCDPSGKTAPENLTRGIGRRHEWSIRYVPLDWQGREDRWGREEPMVHSGETILLTLFDEKEMTEGHLFYKMGAPFSPDTSKPLTFPQSYRIFFKAKDRRVYGFLQGSYDKPYDVYVEDSTTTAAKMYSRINPQQADYNWLTVELHHWKMFDGHMSEGLLYKPENFDPGKKYPIIFYFYERDARTRYGYMAPQPDRSIINIPYFVSNGYLVFDPDIFYKTGAPGEDAYNSVLSAVQYLSRFPWVDTTKIGVEGHSWGGYQVAYLVTRTHLFAAAEAGAPVANMTSAYGGIRWETGISREFQYEHTQSRIGATLWDHPELYIKGSPLFNADKVTTPLLMMANDADGAVPWYQGIEYFSALRRLGKKVWMMEYNGEAHGLTERRNQKDWSIRLSQFFGYYLKGEKPPRWMTEGVPASMKGLDWGLEPDK